MWVTKGQATRRAHRAFSRNAHDLIVVHRTRSGLPPDTSTVNAHGRVILLDKLLADGRDVHATGLVGCGGLRYEAPYEVHLVGSLTPRRTGGGDIR